MVAWMSKGAEMIHSGCKRPLRGGLDYLGRTFRHWEQKMQRPWGRMVSETLRAEDGIGMVPLLDLQLD